jgi:gliding motility-associated-like protein
LSTDTLVLNNLNDGDVVSVAVTSTYSCLFNFPEYSNELVYHLYNPLHLNLTDGPLEVCTGSSVSLEALVTGGNSFALNYHWSTGNFNGSINTFVPGWDGYYMVTVDDGCNLPVSDSVFIELLPAPHANFFWTPEFPSEFMPEISFTDASIDAIQWYWNFGDQSTSSVQNPIHSYSITGLVPVKLLTTNFYGCADSIVKTITIEKAMTIYIPNSFTPNGDGINDEFGVFSYEGINYSLSIFNRWGKEIFRSSSPLNKWNGMNSKGKYAPSGNYVYLVSVSEGTFNKTFSGNFTLIR